MKEKAISNKRKGHRRPRRVTRQHFDNDFVRQKKSQKKGCHGRQPHVETKQQKQATIFLLHSKGPARESNGKKKKRKQRVCKMACAILVVGFPKSISKTEERTPRRLPPPKEPNPPDPLPQSTSTHGAKPVKVKRTNPRAFPLVPEAQENPSAAGHDVRRSGACWMCCR